MRILIYEALPDINKAKMFAEMARQLQKQGHQLLLLLEEQLVYTLDHCLTEQGVISCHHTIAAYVADDPNLPYTLLPVPASTYQNVTEENIADVLATVRTARLVYYHEIFTGFKPDITLIWNGQAEHQQDFLSITSSIYARVYYLEHGWFPQSDTLYLDPLGVNAASLLSKTPTSPLSEEQLIRISQWQKDYLASSPISQPKKNHLFIPLQIDTDTNISLYSPFPSMQLFIRYLENWVPSHYSITIRPHPLANYRYPLESLRADVIFDQTTPIEQLIAESSIVVGINSTVLLQAMAYGKATYAFGEGVFSSSGCIKRLKREDRFPIPEAIDPLVSNQFLYQLIFEKQISIGQYDDLLKDIDHSTHTPKDSSFAYHRYSRAKVLLYKTIHRLALYLRLSCAPFKQP